MDTHIMITVSGLTKHYGDRIAVHDMSFDVAAGRVTGFVGPNGAGKSTTMRMMVGLTRPDIGGVRLANGIGLGSTVSELRSAYPSTAEGLWSDSSFVPTGFYVPEADGTTTIDGDVAWDVVTQLQSALVAEGAALTVNGVAGPDTAAALTAYSERAGLDGAPAAFDALGITGPPPEAMVVRLSAGDWFWELSCGGLEPLGIPSGC